MDRIKGHIKGLTISSILILLPMFVGIFLWNELPDKLPGHFDINNQVDRYDPKWVIVFVLPIIMLMLHLLCCLATIFSNKQKFPDKVMVVLFAIIPVISNAVTFLSYSTALNKGITVDNVGAFLFAVIGMVNIVLGNYLPKVQQNHAYGVRISTTFESNRNWAYTNRLAAWCFVITGIIIVLASLISFFTGNTWILIVMLIIGMLVTTIIPVSASIGYKNKHKNEEGYYNK